MPKALFGNTKCISARVPHIPLQRAFVDGDYIDASNRWQVEDAPMPWLLAKGLQVPPAVIRLGTNKGHRRRAVTQFSFCTHPVRFSRHFPIFALVVATPSAVPHVALVGGNEVARKQWAR